MPITVGSREWGVGSRDGSGKDHSHPYSLLPLSEHVVAAQSARPEPGQEHDRETGDCHPGCATATPAGGYPVMDGKQVNNPGDERHHLFRIVVPVTPVALVVPEDARRDA